MLARLETMVLMAGLDLPVSAIREQIASAIDIVVQQTRFACGTRKVTHICEVTGVESGRIQLQTIFEFKQTGLDRNGKTEGYSPAAASSRVLRGAAQDRRAARPRNLQSARRCRSGGMNQSLLIAVIGLAVCTAAILLLRAGVAGFAAYQRRFTNMARTRLEEAFLFIDPGKFSILSTLGVVVVPPCYGC